MSTRLDPQIRGTTFRYTAPLPLPWRGSTFVGGIRCTLRTRYPESSVVSDADAVATGSLDDGHVIITPGVGDAPDTIGLLWLADETESWPTGVIYFDVKGYVDAEGRDRVPIDDGAVEIKPDVTRGN